MNNKNNYNTSIPPFKELNLNEPIIENTPYTISGNLNPNIIISSNKKLNENHNYNSMLKDKVNNLNNKSKELLSNINLENNYNETNYKNDINLNNGYKNNIKKETIDINDIGKIIGGNIENKNFLKNNNDNYMNEINNNYLYED